METKQIAFKGIERVNKGIYCNDNACEEIINLRYEGNTWRNVGEKRIKEDVKGIMKQRSGIYQANILGVYIHNSSKEKYYIVHQKLNLVESVSLYTISEEGMGTIESSGNSLYTLQEEENLLSVSSLNNVLVICTTKQKLYFIWKDEKYSAVNLNIENNGKLIAGAYEDRDVVSGERKIHFYNSEQWSLIYNPASMMQTIYEDLLKSAKENDLYSGLSFFRYAIKMFDGSILYYSNIDFADTNGDNGGNSGSNINSLIFSLEHRFEQPNNQTYRSGACINNVGHHKVDIEFTDISVLKELFELKLISSIDLYMTRPILQVDIDASADEVKKCDDLGLVDESIYTGTLSYYRCPINKKEILNQLSNGLFYKVKTFKKEDVEKTIKNNSSKLSAEILYKDIETLTSNETLVTDNGRNEILFSNNYTYNRKQHLYDLIYKIFNGYNYPRSTADLTQAGGNEFDLLCLLIGVVGGSMYAEIKGEQNNKDFIVRVPISNPISYIRHSISLLPPFLDSVTFYPPRFFMYPTIAGFEVNVYIANEDTAKLVYTKSSDEISFINNFGYEASLYTSNNREYFDSSLAVRFASYTNAVIINPMLSIAESNLKQMSYKTTVGALLPHSPKVINQLSFKNILQLTETDNPFIFPAVNNYAFGDDTSEIISIQATVGQITETKYGLFPLYVFTDIGIYTMGVGTGAIAYANTTPINNQVITNKQTLNIGNSIMYLSDNGLNIIAGRETRLISEAIKGKPDSEKIIATILSDITSNFDFSIDDFSKEDFLEEIKTANFAYDNVHDEVLFICPNYTYVYNVKNNHFHKITDKFNDVYVSGEDVILSKEVYDVYGLTPEELGDFSTSRLRNNSVQFYSPSLENKSKSNRVLIISKPFNLGTRQYKKVSRFILSMSIEGLSWSDAPANTQVWIFGTNNMIDYIPYKNISVASEKGMQDIHISRFFKSFNYAVLVIASKQIECDVSGGSFEYDIVRGRTGQR